MSQTTTPAMTIGTTRAADGVQLGFRQAGHGPGLLILHGAMSSGWSHTELAERLAHDFTVFLPDRRGRGLSPERGQRNGIQTDVADLRALLEATGARFVLGVSSGAIIALHAAVTAAGADGTGTTGGPNEAGGAHEAGGPLIEKLAVFEPPLFTDSAHPAALLDQFDRAIARGRLAAAAVIGMQGAELGPPVLNRMPVWMVSPMVRLGMRIEARQMAKQEAGPAPSEYVPMTELIPLLHDDFEIVSESSRGGMTQFDAIDVPVRLIGSQKSPAYLGAALAGLALALPRADRITLPGVGHAVSWNTDRGGRPDVLAEAVSAFLHP